MHMPIRFCGIASKELMPFIIGNVVIASFPWFCPLIQRAHKKLTLSMLFVTTF